MDVMGVRCACMINLIIDLQDLEIFPYFIYFSYVPVKIPGKNVIEHYRVVTEPKRILRIFSRRILACASAIAIQ